MGLFRKNHGHVNDAQKRAVEAVYELLRDDNGLMGRKRLDYVAFLPQAVVVCHWGFDREEAERKQRHALAVLLHSGLVVDDYGYTHDAVVIGGVEAIISIPLAENGGAEGIAACIAQCRNQHHPAMPHSARA